MELPGARRTLPDLESLLDQLLQQRAADHSLCSLVTELGSDAFSRDVTTYEMRIKEEVLSRRFVSEGVKPTDAARLARYVIYRVAPEMQLQASPEAYGMSNVPGSASLPNAFRPMDIGHVRLRRILAAADADLGTKGEELRVAIGVLQDMVRQNASEEDIQTQRADLKKMMVNLRTEFRGPYAKTALDAAVADAKIEVRTR